MKRFSLLLFAWVISVGLVLALPPLQHSARGTVVEIRGNELVLALTVSGKDTPAVFAIKEGRTRWRENGSRTSGENLQRGQMVRVYYRKEMGVWVATEVSWSSRSRQNSRTK